MKPRPLIKNSLIALGTLISLTVLVCVITNPTPLAAAVSDEDCVEFQVSDNGWHTNFYLSADVFPEDHLFRQDYPAARYFVIGWGDEGFYIKGPSVRRGLDAVIPPSPTVVHVIALDRAPDVYFLDKSLPYSLSAEGMGQLVREIDASLKSVCSATHYL